MANSEKTTTSLLEKILDGAIESIKRPFVIKRVKRAFASAEDSLEEQLLGIQAKQATARENLVKAAKEEGNLTSSIQRLIDLQNESESVEMAKVNLAMEKRAFLGEE